MGYEATITRDDNWFIGEDKRLRFTVYAEDATDAEVADGTGAKQDITGWELEWVLDPVAAGVEPVITKTTAEGITIMSGVGGECEVQVDDDDTDDLAAGHYHHTLRRTDEGEESVLAFGSVVLRRPAS